jgi:predicted transcriptional regulator
MKKITLDLRADVHQRLRLLSVVLDRSISSIASEAIEKALLENAASIPVINTDIAASKSKA